MMNYKILKAELSLAKYLPMSDKEAADSLNAKNIVKSRNAISGSELFSYTDSADYGALTEDKKQQWLQLCGIDLVNKNAIPIIKSIFPSDTTTWGNIIKTENISRAQELGLQLVKVGHIIDARV